MRDWGKVVPPVSSVSRSDGCWRIPEGEATSSFDCVGGHTLAQRISGEPSGYPVMPRSRGFEGKFQISPALSSSSATYHIFNFAWGPIGSERTV